MVSDKPTWADFYEAVKKLKEHEEKMALTHEKISIVVEGYGWHDVWVKNEVEDKTAWAVDRIKEHLENLPPRDPSVVEL